MSDSQSNHGGESKHQEENFRRLLEEFRRQFDEVYDKEYLLTLA